MLRTLQSSDIAVDCGSRQQPQRSRAAGWLTALLGSRTAGSVRHMRHVETLALGPKRSLYLVECDGQRFLIAAGEGSMSSPVAVRETAPESSDQAPGDAE